MVDFTSGDEIKCSKCGHTWRDKYAFEYQVGTEVECPECRTVLQCVDLVLSRSWAWEAVREEQTVAETEVGDLGTLLSADDEAEEAFKKADARDGSTFAEDDHGES
jgi:hypothetical protein